MLLKAEITQNFKNLQYYEHTPGWELMEDVYFDNFLEEAMNSGAM